MSKPGLVNGSISGVGISRVVVCKIAKTDWPDMFFTWRAPDKDRGKCFDVSATPITNASREA
jgi:hypothetical protein